MIQWRDLTLTCSGRYFTLSYQLLLVERISYFSVYTGGQPRKLRRSVRIKI